MPSTPEQTEPEWRPPSYWPFVLPALIVVLTVIIFPWLFTIWMSLNEWKVGSPTTFVGLANYLRMPNDPRFVEAVWHTLVYTALSVILPLVFRYFVPFGNVIDETFGQLPQRTGVELATRHGSPSPQAVPSSPR